jgi:hypothetical protein
MTNPFSYGGVVGTSSFCNRTEDLQVLRRTVDNAGRLFLYAERRMGKTSLVHVLLDTLSDEDYVAAYVDLWPTDGPASFTKAMAKATAEASSTTDEKLLENARTFFSSLRPSVTVDESGAPVLTFGAEAPSGTDPEIEEVLAAPAKAAALTGKRVVVVFDEFQQIATYETGRVERQLRSEIQHHEEVAYLFLGSRRHLIREMLLDSKRPLYRSAQHYPLRAIDEADWQPFIRERFEAASKSIPAPVISEVCQITEGHPFYVQHLCHVLWERCEQGSDVALEDVHDAVQILLDRESYAYTALWEGLTMNQQRVLLGLAQESGDVQPFSSEFVRRYQLGSPSSVQRAVEALMEKDLIDRDNGSFVVLDRFFQRWVLRQHGASA